MVDLGVLYGIGRHPLNRKETDALTSAIHTISGLKPIRACSVISNQDLSIPGVEGYYKDKLLYQVGKALYENGFIREENNPSRIEPGHREITLTVVCLMQNAVIPVIEKEEQPNV